MDTEDVEILLEAFGIEILARSASGAIYTRLATIKTSAVTHCLFCGTTLCKPHPSPVDVIQFAMGTSCKECLDKHSRKWKAVCKWPDRQVEIPEDSLKQVLESAHGTR